MTKKGAKNHAASVKQRLLNLSSKSKEEFGLVLIRYALERLLFRLSQSAFRDQFVVKGATLFALWTGEPHRATRDLDLLGIGSTSLDRLRDVFSAVCKMPADEDGLSFDAASVKVSRIKEDQEYEGCRVELMASLGTARHVASLLRADRMSLRGLRWPHLDASDLAGKDGSTRSFQLLARTTFR